MATYENGDPIITIMPIAVFLDHRLTANEMRVIGAILSFRNKDTGTCSVRRETLAKRCGLPLTKISTFTTSLVKKGWLEKTGNGGLSKASTYRITVPDMVTVTESVTVTDPVTQTVTESVTQTVTESVTKTVTEMVTGKEQSIEQSKEQSIEQSRERVRATRLSNDLKLTSDWYNFCRSERQDLDPKKTFERFKDYWISKSGKDATKTDWFATWRNWVRNEKAQHKTLIDFREQRAQRAVDEFVYGTKGRVIDVN